MLQYWNCRKRHLPPAQHNEQEEEHRSKDLRALAQMELARHRPEDRQSRPHRAAEQQQGGAFQIFRRSPNESSAITPKPASSVIHFVPVPPKCSSPSAVSKRHSAAVSYASCFSHLSLRTSQNRLLFPYPILLLYRFCASLPRQTGVIRTLFLRFSKDPPSRPLFQQSARRSRLFAVRREQQQAAPPSRPV